MVQCHNYGDEFNRYFEQGLDWYHESNDNRYNEYNEYLNCTNNNPNSVCSKYDSRSRCDEEEGNAKNTINECHSYYND